jgi:hypothetical protein
VRPPRNEWWPVRRKMPARRWERGEESHNEECSIKHLSMKPKFAIMERE